MEIKKKLKSEKRYAQKYRQAAGVGVSRSAMARTPVRDIYRVIVISMPAGFRRHLVGKLLEMFVILMSLNYALSVDDHVDILLN